MCKATLQWRRAVYVAHINSFINSYCHEVYYVCTAAANSPAEHLVCCVLCMFPQFSKDKCKPVTEICRTPPNARYLGIEMFNSVYNHPPTPPFKYHNMTLGHICQKRKAFPRKNALIGHRSISLQSVCAKITSSRTLLSNPN